MSESADESGLDLQYFIDRYRYNCPFCNRRHVSYHLVGSGTEFDWSAEKKCYVYFVHCDSCARESLHFSFEKLGIAWAGQSDAFRFDFDHDIDSKVFYSIPTSFFVIDDRIPQIIRELIAEAEAAQKMNFLTGASACARKAIYEFCVKEKAEGKHYEEKIKSLKARFIAVDPALLDVLAHIQDMTSDKIHEQSWPKWDSKNLKLIIETLKAILHEVYVVPHERTRRSEKIRELLGQVKGKSTE